MNEQLALLMGRLHPLLVHLPIGILLFGFGMECLARWAGRKTLRPAIRLALAVGAGSAVFTALTGWLLARQGGYDAGLLQVHQWLGFGAAALAVVSWFGQQRPWYFPVFFCGTAVLALAGHYGGSLTHGAGFLVENKNRVVETGQSKFVLKPDTAVFAALVEPILKSKCVSCHNAAKFKGELRLDAPAFIQKGGKNGAVVEPGNPAGSPLLQRLLLPLHHDDHMPPAGKPQPDGLELKILEWWVARGADFNLKMRDAALPSELEAALQQASGAGQNPVFAKAVSQASPGAIAALRDQFVGVQSLGAGQPWLAVSFAGIPKPGAAHWAALKKVSRQTVDLDISHTGFRGSSDVQLAGFPHLTRLHLAHTQVQDAVGPELARLEYLEFLNLTGTAVTDALAPFLEKMPRLKNLYIWQTGITERGLAQLKNRRPELRVHTGAQIPDTALLALRPPGILVARSFFQDTLHVTLDYPAFRGVSLYYTIDEAASPTSRSARYRSPIVLDRTAHVRAFAGKEGWAHSAVVDAALVKKRLAPRSAILEKPPSPKYAAQGGASLIDDKIAALQGEDGWLGYEGGHLVATLDMGKAVSVSQVFVHCLENNVAWIFKPVAIEVETSVDGKRYARQAMQSFPENTGMGIQQTHLLSCPLAQQVKARYVRVRVRSPLTNPAWHPRKGQKCWIFVDEVVVD